MITPRSYQVAGIQKLASALSSYKRALDASDTGTGKTFKALFALKQLRRYPIIICPRAVVTAWEKALEAVDLRGEVWTYGLVRNEKLPGGRWKTKTKRVQVFEYTGVSEDAVFVFDEVQHCKGQKTQNSKLLIAARRANVPTLCLSATPASDPTEMKALGYVLGLYPSPNDWYYWAMRHGCYPGAMGGLVYNHASGGMEKIGQALAPIMDRVRKNDVPGFPACDNQIEVIDLPKGETLDSDYRKLLEALQDEAETESVEALRIRQLIELKKLQPLADRAKDFIEQGHSVVVFLNYSKSIDIMSKALGAESVIFDGRLSKREREQNLSLFQGDDAKAIIVQIRAGGVGVNMHDIHGHRPRISLICATGSAELFYQASGRIHRDGAKTKAINKLVVAAKSPEMKLLKVLEQNRNSLEKLTDADLIPAL